MDFPPFSNVSTVFQYFTPANSSHSDIWRNMSVIFKVFKNSPEILSFWTDSTCFYALNSLHCCKINFIKWGRQLEGFIWHLTTSAKLVGGNSRQFSKNLTFLWKHICWTVTDDYGTNLLCFIHCLQISISLHINDMVIEDFHKNWTDSEQISHPNLEYISHPCPLLYRYVTHQDCGASYPLSVHIFSV